MPNQKTRFVGLHEGCGGDVYYHATSTMGIRFCKRCGQSSHNHWRDTEGKLRASEAPVVEGEKKHAN